jgi:hypothetical protein
VFLHAPSAAWRVEVEVLEDGKRVAIGEDQTAVATGRVAVTIPYAKLWSPSRRISTICKCVSTTARSCSTKSLVRRIARHRTASRKDSDQRQADVSEDGSRSGFLADGYLTAPSDEALQADIGWTKLCGFNGVEKHQKIEDPRWLYWCDRLGLLVWEEMPNAREWSSKGEKLLSAEWQTAVRATSITHASFVGCR